MARASLIGRRFGRLLVLSGPATHSGRSFYDCVCDCGNHKRAQRITLMSGRNKSCGCLMAERLSSAKLKLLHRGAYTSWRGMNERCHCKNHNRYHRYGGRGIVVCERWRHSFENFLADMGDRPAGTSLDRKNNDGPYSPENCRWATHAMQSANQPKPLYALWGKEMGLKEWAAFTGIPSGTLRRRVWSGMSLEEAITRPRIRRGKSHAPR